MKKFILCCFFIVVNHSSAANYTLTIDGQAYDVDAGKNTTLTLADGKTITINLAKKSILSFATDNFSFEHPQAVTPARTDLGDGIHQTMMTTPLGTLVLVQEYEGMSPGLLVGMMVHELTKEEKDYGYTIETSDTEKTLSSGEKMTGKTVVASYQGEITSRDVLTLSKGRGGLMIITMHDNETPAEDMRMIETFWQSLKVITSQ